MKTMIRRLFVVAALAMLASAAHANAPAERWTISPNAVLDNKTGLTWERSPYKGTFSEASGKCTGAWRVPNIRELATIVDFSQKDPAIDTWAFPNLPTDLSQERPYWSSTPSSGSTTNAWMILFISGMVTTRPQTDTAYIRCVQ